MDISRRAHIRKCLPKTIRQQYRKSRIRAAQGEAGEGDVPEQARPGPESRE